MELLRWRFDLAYCEYGGKHFVQDRGPIGLRDTREIAIIHMEDFELKVIETSPYRLVCMWITVKQYSADHLNTIKPGVIEFKKKGQEGDTLPGLG